jgi:hypothetical protein
VPIREGQERLRVNTDFFRTAFPYLSNLSDHGLYLVINSVEIVDLSDQRLAKLGKNYSKENAQWIDMVSKAPKVAKCEECPNKFTPLPCQVTNIVIPLLPIFEKMVSSDRIIAVWRNEVNDSFLVKKVDIQTALADVVLSGMLNSCQSLKGLKRYFANTNPLMSGTQIAELVFLNVLSEAEGDPQKGLQAFAELEELFLMHTEEAIKRLHDLSQSDAFANAFVLVNNIVDLAALNYKEYLDKISDDAA